MLEWPGLTSGQLLRFLESLTILLFVSAALPGLAKRHRLRRAAVFVYAAAVLFAVALILLWWIGIDFR